MQPDNKRKWRADDPRRLRMAETRAAILHAACPILLRDGLGGTTLDRVAAEGGIAKMTLYRHFPNKEALFEGLVISMCDDMRTQLETAADPAQPSPEQLTIELRAFVAALLAPELLALYRLIVADGWRFPALSRVFEQTGMRIIRRRIASLLALQPDHAFQRAGEIIALALGDAYQRAILGIAEADDAEIFTQQIAAAVAHARIPPNITGRRGQK